MFAKEESHFAPIVINNEELGLVNSAKLLGVTISNNLTWNEHINEIIKKASKRLYFISQLRRARVAKQDLVLFYTSCIRSILTYASPVFFYVLPEYLKNEIERIQNLGLLELFALDIVIMTQWNLRTLFQLVIIS